MADKNIAGKHDTGDFFPFLDRRDCNDVSPVANSQINYSISHPGSTGQMTPAQEQEQPSFGGQIGITPRSLLFPNLDEAHRNITHKAPHTPWRNASAESKSSTPSKSCEDIALEEFCSPMSNISFAKMPQNFPLSRPGQVNHFELPNPSRAGTGRSLTNRRGISTKTSHDDPTMQARSGLSGHAEDSLGDTSMRAQYPDTSGSTVGQILDQYAGDGDNLTTSFTGSDGHGYMLSNAHQTHKLDPISRAGATTRCGFRGEEGWRPNGSDKDVTRHEAYASAIVTLTDEGADLGKSRLQNVQPLSEAPEEELPRTPTPILSQRWRIEGWLDPETGEYERTPPDTDTDSEYQIELPPNEDLMPAPLRVASASNQRAVNRLVCGEQFVRNDEVSSMSSAFGDASTESNEDPFKYDNKDYQSSLRFAKERDVSQALHEASFFDTYGDAAVNKYEQGLENSMAVAPTDRHRHRGRPEGGFFISSSIHPTNAVSEQDRNVKVIINPKQPAESSGKHCKDSDKNIFGLSIERDHAHTDKMPKELASNGDWVTEASSEVGFGDTFSQGQSFDQAIKETGSSIADFSDNEWDARQDILGSQGHILQHPSRGSMSTGYEVRMVRGTDRQVSVPKTQIPGNHGFAQNSMRLNPNFAKRRDAPTLGRTLTTNPFKRKSSTYQRADPSSNFTFKTGGPSKYEFRDSISEYGPSAPAINSNQATHGTYGTIPSSSMASIDTKEILDGNSTPIANEEERFSHFGISKNEDPLPLQNAYGRETPDLESRNLRGFEVVTSGMDMDSNQFNMSPDFSDGPSPIGSKFGFPLLGLAQAQALQKTRRESGVQDETIDGSIRFKQAKQAMGRLSGRRRTNTPSPLSLPPEVHLKKLQVERGSQLTTSFTLPNTDPNSPDQVSPLSTESQLHRNMSTASPSPATPDTVFSPQTPGASGGGWFGRSTPHLLPVDKRSRRNGFDNAARDQERVTEEHFITDKARLRRDFVFQGMAALSILPFITIVVKTKAFSSALSSLTEGEVDKLTRRQLRIIMFICVAFVVIYTSVFTAIIVYFVTNSKVPS